MPDAKNSQEAECEICGVLRALEIQHCSVPIRYVIRNNPADVR